MNEKMLIVSGDKEKIDRLEALAEELNVTLPVNLLPDGKLYQSEEGMLYAGTPISVTSQLKYRMGSSAKRFASEKTRMKVCERYGIPSDVYEAIFKNWSNLNWDKGETRTEYTSSLNRKVEYFLDDLLKEKMGENTTSRMKFKEIENERWAIEFFNVSKKQRKALEKSGLIKKRPIGARRFAYALDDVERVKQLLSDYENQEIWDKMFNTITYLYPQESGDGKVQPREKQDARK